jgi:hypothetical protein
VVLAGLGDVAELDLRRWCVDVGHHAAPLRTGTGTATRRAPVDIRDSSSSLPNGRDPLDEYAY